MEPDALVLEIIDFLHKNHMLDTLDFRKIS